jgi:hypothetical protein
MRNLKLIDGVVALHEIARMVQEETEHTDLHNAIRECADRLHLLSVEQGQADREATNIINQLNAKGKP